MRVVIVAVMAVCLVLGSARCLFAQDGKGGHGKGKISEEILKKFDKDGDGKLNDEEKAAAKAAMEAKKAEREKKMLAEFDKDGDGKLSDEEKAARDKKMEENKKKMLEKFDTDKDGKLSDEEKTEMKKWMKEHRGEKK
ncbi:MAG: EF-hand domain-containing protein [Kiritimatiellae bacterium]|nr:EF-hand domain-containing protein [Kiritimatiellia bacterium]MDD5520609.1 EF-hand domain-containing protein [Kiritimatiellia bacterium]